MNEKEIRNEYHSTKIFGRLLQRCGNNIEGF